MTAMIITHTRNARRQGPSKPFFRAFAERLRRRRELRALLSQPDYLLADIGVDKADIQHEASKPFWLE